ncbi:MAG TPA: TRAFs-binding domain-containing protein [Thermoanaerobaculia bacterium]|jgi:hypothetical protein|nr:TRAFs-binding domain-containing protein [Thermoanaerobaculia bacterium]
MSAPREYCFVLMPFQKKKDAAGREINFDAVYDKVIRPSIEACGLLPIRADEEMAGGSIHKQMFERLMLCPYAIADLTTANANVFYELGIRHAARPLSTVMIFSRTERLPFDIGMERSFPYDLDDQGEPTKVEEAIEGLKKRLAEAMRIARRNPPTADSPVYEFVTDFTADISRVKTDLFHERADFAAEKKKQLQDARQAKSVEALAAIEDSISDYEAVEGGVLVDLLLAWRGIEQWDRMIGLVGRMPGPLAASVLVREQYAFALNRKKRRAEAEQVLLDLIAKRGPSGETYGLLGRVYKDLWDDAVKAGDEFEAAGRLDWAIDAYLKGFEADWRDAYPGVNAVTLMELRDPPDPRRIELVPVVRYAASRRVSAGKADYWDYATLLELAVIGRDEQAGRTALQNALPRVREVWEPKTTLRNLTLIDEARKRRGEDQPAWVSKAMAALQQKAGP